MLYERTARGTVGEVVTRVEAATRDHKFGVLGTIDLKSKLAEKGVDLAPGCTVVEVCNPVQAQRVLEEEIVLATMLPCRIAVYEKGGTVCVGTLRPTGLVQLFNNPALRPVAEEVEQVLLRIIDAACA
ncbi:MAG: DUF302 domain-containing protein [Armatimonadetes bacterium]|nr:DUF302 domain-containing protein [Armatimonadota bacterium]